MAFLFGDSFDFYTVGTFNSEATSYGQWTAVSGQTAGVYPSISSAVTRFTFGKSLGPNMGGGYRVYAQKTGLPQSSNTVFFATAINSYVNGATTSYDQSVELIQGSTIQVAMVVRSDGAILFYRGGTDFSAPTSGTLIATCPAGTILNNVWTHLNVKVVLSATVGEIHIRKDGATSDTWSATGLNTMATANAYCDGVALQISGTASYFDDFMLYDSSGSAPNDFVGDIRCYSLSPTSDSAQKDFTASSGANWNCVKETACDGDATYVYSSTVGAEDLYNFASLSSTPAAIYAVKVRAVVRKSDAGTRYGQTAIKSSSTTSIGTSTILSTSYLGLNTVYTTDPNTGVAWTAAAVNSLQAGFKVAG